MDNFRKCATKQNEFKELCIEALQSAGYRITNARLSVIDCLASALSPLSAPEIFKRIVREAKSAENHMTVTPDRVSVYRTVEVLNPLNLIHRVGASGAYIVCSNYDSSNCYHILSHCQSCNKVEEMEVPSELVAPLIFHLKERRNFSPYTHLIQIEGRCLDCSDND